MKQNTSNNHKIEIRKYFNEMIIKCNIQKHDIELKLSLEGNIQPHKQMLQKMEGWKTKIGNKERRVQKKMKKKTNRQQRKSAKTKIIPLKKIIKIEKYSEKSVKKQREGDELSIQK